MSDKLHRVVEGLYVFHCPGCDYGHHVRVAPVEGHPGPVWNWNGSLDKPTVTPSLLVAKDHPEMVCHSYITDGKIQFMSDCFHSLKGQTVDLPDWED